jgi:hypothetical protein
MSRKTIDFSKPLQTVNGEPVTIVTMDGRGEYPVLGYIGDAPRPSSWSLTGKRDLLDENPYDFDLVNVPEYRYLCLYRGGANVVASLAYESRAEAEEFSNSVDGFIKIVEVEL